MFTEYLEKNDLLGLLAPAQERLPIPPANDRAKWNEILKSYREEICEAAQTQREMPYPQLLATQFLAFVRTEDRTAYESPYFQRRRLLLCAMLAECIAYNGTYLDQTIDGLWCICEESFWGISAHNGSSHPGVRPAKEHPLPDVENPYIDLFAAQTSSLLLWTCYLLKEKLNEVTPLIVRRVRLEVERRILKPFFHHDDFWWMGMTRRDMCNWTPWILSNIMGSLLLTPMEDSRLAEGMARAMRMLDSYLAVMPADGGCDEGASYWNMAGGALLDCLEHVYNLTGGRASFYGEPLIRNIGVFPLHAHIAGPYYWNFADCDAQPIMDGERVYRYGTRTGNEALAALGYEITASQKTVLPKDTPETFRVLCKLFFPVQQVSKNACKKHANILPNLQVWASSKDGMYAAMKGGHNGESHNHNDVGTFLLYVDGEPQIVDAGNLVYTAKTFGPDRYTLWNTRSMNHNVPLIGAFEQAPGREFAARDVFIQDSGMSMDMASAYPPEAGVLLLGRTASLQDAKFTVSDAVKLKFARPVTWVFLFRNRPELIDGQLKTGKIMMCFDPALIAECSEIPITDKRMSKNYPGSLWRFSLTQPYVTEHSQVFEFLRRTDV